MRRAIGTAKRLIAAVGVLLGSCTMGSDSDDGEGVNPDGEQEEGPGQPEGEGENLPIVPMRRFFLCAEASALDVPSSPSPIPGVEEIDVEGAIVNAPQDTKFFPLFGVECPEIELTPALINRYDVLLSGDDIIVRVSMWTDSTSDLNLPPSNHLMDSQVRFRFRQDLMLTACEAFSINSTSSDERILGNEALSGLFTSEDDPAWEVFTGEVVGAPIVRTCGKIYPASLEFNNNESSTSVVPASSQGCDGAAIVETCVNFASTILEDWRCTDAFTEQSWVRWN